METKIGHINIRGFIVKNVIDFDEVGGFRICLEEDMIKYLSRDKVREMMSKQGHKSFDVILDKMLDIIFGEREEVDVDG
jgi:hypothetical protein